MKSKEIEPWEAEFEKETRTIKKISFWILVVFGAVVGFLLSRLNVPDYLLYCWGLIVGTLAML